MSDMKTALKKAMGDRPRKIVTPWDPSRRAVARVLNPLPAPANCPNCGGTVEAHKNSLIYGREYGEWPWMYVCMNKTCDTYVGMHPFTGIPLGTMANKGLRDARKKAKDMFNPIWQNGEMTRSEAYQWLAERTGIPLAECHFGWTDLERCDLMIMALRKREKVMA